MIQEKDFLYRVPVKTAPITTPRGQIRNPEILVDLEGGEFMHGSILDANSTNKLVNQSVKEAVDNKIIEGGYVTKDLLEAETTRATEQENSLKTLIGAETSARTKGDEDLSSKIKAEQTRAEGKEKEISDKLAIVNGDSNTEGSFRKAIADVVAAAPEDLDTLKEIADKLAGNDDLHTALNQAIATKADATALSNYVLTTALNKQVDTLNAAISAKQDAGNYIPYNEATDVFYYLYNTGIIFKTEDDSAKTILSPVYFEKYNDEKSVTIRNGYINISNVRGNIMTLNNDDRDGGIVIYKQLNNRIEESLRILEDGIRLMGGDDNHVLTSNASTIDITEYAKKTDIPEVSTSDFVSKTTMDVQTLKSQLKIYNTLNLVDGSTDDYITIVRSGRIQIEGYGETSMMISNRNLLFSNSDAGISIDGDNGEITIFSKDFLSGQNFRISKRGINIPGSDNKHVLTAANSTIDITQYALKSELPTVPTKTSQLTNDSNFMAANVVQDAYFGLEKELKIYSEADNKIMTIGHTGIKFETNKNIVSINDTTIDITSNKFANKTKLGLGFITFSYNDNVVKFSSEGIRSSKFHDCLATSDGTFIPLSEFVDTATYNSKIAALEARITALEAKHPEAAA